MTHFEIRRAAPGDAQALVALVRELATYERHPEAVSADPAEVAKQLEATCPPLGALLGWVDGEAVAYSVCFFNYSTWLGRPGLYIEDMYVRPEHRRKGIARAMLIELAKIARDRGCGRMEWVVMDWNQLGQSFFAAHGAQENSGWKMYRWDEESINAVAETSVASPKTKPS
jgi:GNAT superfamily N-acetyltransferase